jgi:hypothetical protein
VTVRTADRGAAGEAGARVGVAGRGGDGLLADDQHLERVGDAFFAADADLRFLYLNKAAQTYPMQLDIEGAASGDFIDMDIEGVMGTDFYRRYRQAQTQRTSRISRLSTRKSASGSTSASTR